MTNCGLMMWVPNFEVSIETVGGCQIVKYIVTLHFL
jgi:hypothetical protein